MDTPETSPAASAPADPVECARCGRASPAESIRCTLCGALLPGRAPETRVRAHYEIHDHTHRGVSWLFGIFTLLLISNIGLFWFFKGQPDVEPMPEPQVRTAAIAFTVVEAIDTVLVIFAAFACARLIPVPADGGKRRRFAWLIGLPLLAILLVINHGYHWVLMELAGVEPEKDQILQSGYHREWLVALMCIQPAIIEELFFRRLVFDFFRSHTEVGTAAFASAVMFAAAHTGGLISLPYLTLFGFAAAWLRWWSGSLALPMIVHFLHNLLISLHELDSA